MASVVGICNSALIKLGAQTVMSVFPPDDKKNARLCNEQYDKMRQKLLREHLWNFAIERVKLAQLGAAPAFGWDHAYQLPSNWLRVVSVHDNDAGIGTVRYRIEGRSILSDADELWLRYVKDVSDAGTFDSAFAESLAWLLAADLAPAITQSNTALQLASEGLRNSLQRARDIDSIEDFPEETPESSWVSERYRGTGSGFWKG